MQLAATVLTYEFCLEVCTMRVIASAPFLVCRAFLVTWLLLVPFAFVAGLGFVAIPTSLVIGYELLGYEASHILSL